MQMDDSDAIDPDLTFSYLPQPYRMITKIVELEIFDPVWLEITRRHPDLLLGSDGQPISIKRNFALEKVCPPSKSLTSTELVQSIVKISDLIITTSSTGVLTIRDRLLNSIRQSYDLKPKTDNATAVKIVSSGWISACCEVETSIILCVCLISQSTSQKEPPPPQKGKKPAVVEVVLEKKNICHIFILNIPKVRTTNLSVPSDPIQCRGIQIEVGEDDNETTVTADICKDVNVVLITSRKCGCSVIPWNLQESLETDQTIPLPDHTLCLDKTDFFLGHSVRSSKILPLQLRDPESSVVSVPSRELNLSFEAIICYSDLCEWSIVDVNVAANKDMPDRGQLLNAVVLAKWTLPAPVTISCLDSRRGYQILGLKDGSVSLWNTRSRSLIATTGRHRSPVTAISFCVSNSAALSFHFMSGATDGTLFFHAVHPTQEADPMHDGVASKSNIGPKRSPLACSLGSTLAFRHDAVDSAVVGIKTTPGIPLACVVYHDGTLALYDFETNVLLGQLRHSTDLRDTSTTFASRYEFVDQVANTAQHELGEAATTAAVDGVTEETTTATAVDDRLSEVEKTARKIIVGHLVSFDASGVAAISVSTGGNDSQLCLFGTADIALQYYPVLQGMCDADRKDEVLQYLQKLTKEERISGSITDERRWLILGGAAGGLSTGGKAGMGPRSGSALKPHGSQSQGSLHSKRSDTRGSTALLPTAEEKTRPQTIHPWTSAGPSDPRETEEEESDLDPIHMVRKSVMQRHSQGRGLNHGQLFARMTNLSKSLEEK